MFVVFFFFLMYRRPPRSTRTATLFPYTTLFRSLSKDYEKPQWDLPHTTIDGKQVAIEEQAALKKPFCNLIRFHRISDAKSADPRVLLVAPLSGHHATLLRDTVREIGRASCRERVCQSV